MKEGYSKVSEFNDGYCIVVDHSGKYGLMYENGKICISCIFDEIDKFVSDVPSHGVAPVRIRDKWTLVKECGTMISDPIYDRVYPMVNKLCVFKLNNKFGAINRKGVLKIVPIYDSYGDVLAHCLH